MLAFKVGCNLIVVHVFPLCLPLMQLEALLQSGNGYLLGVVVVGGFSLLLSLFILPLLNEKNSQVHAQLTTC